MIGIKTGRKSITIKLIPTIRDHNNFQALTQKKLVADLEIDV